ncbi:MAG: hypothetical protein GY711_27965 [bacterium]|nr:hypothetical protein [bacterium]
MRPTDLFAASILILPAAGQSMLYDAGPAGTPPLAPSPTFQGWSQTLTGTVTLQPLSPDASAMINAWQINDFGPGYARYEKDDWADELYDVELVMRPLAGTIYVEIDSGDLITNSVFGLELELVGADIVVHHGGPTPVVCPNAADGAYHEFRFTGRSFYLDLFYDGVFQGVVEETAWGLAVWGSGLRWGTLPGIAGRARFHRVEMTMHDWGPIGSSYCGPAVPHSGGIPARIEAEGEASWHHRSIRLYGRDLPPNQFGYFLAGQTQGFVAGPGGSQGNLCLNGTIGRYVGLVQNSGDLGMIWIDVGLRNIPTTPPSDVGPGETWNFQAWFRDTNPTSTSNFTDGVSVSF